MLKIKDIVQLDTKGEFRSDVQLSDFDNPTLNLSLLQSYIFSVSIPNSFGERTQSIAGVGLLDEIVKAFKYDRFENRFVAIANYGHGKSHLALVLANYFSRPVDSPEVKTVFDRIAYAVEKPAKAEGYRDFKQERKEFLVLQLRGDDPRPLREQFFRALKKALSEHEATRGVELPFWVNQAKQHLASLSADQIEAANAFLEANFHLDVPALTQEIEEYREQAYNWYEELFAHLSYGVRPNLDANVSLREAIGWAVREYCADGKPLGGLLILFDEFSLYVQRYARDKAVGELQDLLQGVQDQRERAAFLAFAQHDPDEVATQMLHGGQPLQSLKKELERLPKRFALYSLMESVLDSYLKQFSTAWDAFLQNPKVKGMLYGDISETTWDVFGKHYAAELMWTNQKFRDVVVQGCFPLHPTTTALLCQLKMHHGEGISGTRTVLGFVRDQLDLIGDWPAHEDGQVNWVLPIALVDYFEKRLAGDNAAIYEAYLSAQRNLDLITGEISRDEQHKVLKALLLQHIAHLPGANRKQAELLAHLSGLDERTTLEILKELSGQNIIRYDPVHRINSFWPVGMNPRRLAEAIEEKKQSIDRDPGKILEDLNRLLQSDPFYSFGSVKVDVEWGHPDDWAATEHIISLNAGDSNWLTAPFQLTGRGLEDGGRGALVWVLLEDESERDTARTFAQTYIALQGVVTGSPDTPLPVIAMLPKAPVPELMELYIRYKALQAVGRDPDLRAEIGQQTYETETERTKVDLKQALDRLRGDSIRVWDIPRGAEEIVVSDSYRAVVAASGHGRNAKYVLKQLYELAYHVRPPEFFTQYSALQTRGQNRLRAAIKTVTKNLLRDGISSAINGMDSVSSDLCTIYLSTRHWGLLTSSYELQEPASPKLKDAWTLLDNTFKPGTQDIPVKNVIPTLLNPPNGFDYNTALLLLAGWIGYHRSELQLYHNGPQITLSQLEEQVEIARTSRDFLNWACTGPLAMTRRDPSEALTEMRGIRTRIEAGECFSQDEAKRALLVLNDFIAQEKQPADQRQQAADAADKLQAALEVSQKYDADAQAILRDLESQVDVPNLLALRQKKSRLTAGKLVEVTQPPVSEIESRILAKLEQALVTERKRIEGLADITHVGTARQRLQNIQKRLEGQGLTTFVKQVKSIEDLLRERTKLLKVAQQEQNNLEVIKAMTPAAPLETLRDYCDKLTGMQLASPEAIRERDLKLTTIENEISKLVSFVENILHRVRSVDPADIQRLNNEISRHESRYGANENLDKLREARTYLETLEAYEREVREAARMPLTSPHDVSMAFAKLDQVLSRFGNRLSEPHLAKSSAARTQIETAAHAKQQAAVKWLDQLEHESNQEIVSWSRLYKKLQEPPSFLPLESAARLDLLRTRVQEHLDHDQIAEIERLFQSLGSHEKRKECLDRLQQLIVEEA